MMDSNAMEALKRTAKNLVRHLEDLNDEIDRDGGRIKNHMTLDGIKDAVKTLRCIGDMMGGGETAAEPATDKTAVPFEKVKAPTAAVAGA